MQHTTIFRKFLCKNYGNKNLSTRIVKGKVYIYQDDMLVSTQNINYVLKIIGYVEKNGITRGYFRNTMNKTPASSCV